MKPSWSELLAVFAGTFVLTAIATIFYLFVVAYVALNGNPL